MGHIRLGNLPRTRKWIQVTDLVGSGAGTPEVAAAKIDAPQKGLLSAVRDPGLIQSTWLLIQIPFAARKNDFASELRRIGLRISDKPQLLEVVEAFN